MNSWHRRPRVSAWWTDLPDLRLYDRMCPVHQAQALIRWPISGTWQDLRDQCRPCLTTSLLASADGTALPDLPTAVFERAKAIHEAAHVVAGITAGVPILGVEIWDDMERGPRLNGGLTTIATGDWETPVQILAYLAMIWAGQEAADRYLTTAGYGTTANRCDLRYVARHDAAKADNTIAQYFRPGANPATGIHEARTVIDNHWPQIAAVADALIARRILTRQDLDALLATPHRIAR